MKVKTYAESRNKPAFDWNKTLRNLIRRKTDISDEYHDELTGLSGGWVTCACGNQCAIIPRDSDGEPLDYALMWLGVDFDGFIIDKEWANAKATLQKIEQRSSELIAEAYKEKFEQWKKDKQKLNELSASVENQREELKSLGLI